MIAFGVELNVNTILHKYITSYQLTHCTTWVESRANSE
jgi:hypothetical protein